MLCVLVARQCLQGWLLLCVPHRMRLLRGTARSGTALGARPQTPDRELTSEALGQGDL